LKSRVPCRHDLTLDRILVTASTREFVRIGELRLESRLGKGEAG
jgi:hypothetical protein